MIDRSVSNHAALRMCTGIRDLSTCYRRQRATERDRREGKSCFSFFFSFSRSPRSCRSRTGRSAVSLKRTLEKFIFPCKVEKAIPRTGGSFGKSTVSQRFAWLRINRGRMPFSNLCSTTRRPVVTFKESREKYARPVTVAMYFATRYLSLIHLQSIFSDRYPRFVRLRFLRFVLIRDANKT